MTPGWAAVATFLVIWIGCSLGGDVLGLRPGVPGAIGFGAGLVASAIVYRLAGGQPIGPDSD